MPCSFFVIQVINVAELSSSAHLQRGAHSSVLWDRFAVGLTQVKDIEKVSVMLWDGFPQASDRGSYV